MRRPLAKMRQATRQAKTEVPPDEKKIRFSITLLESARFSRTSKTIWSTTFQNAGFTRRAALRCRAACDPGKNLLPGASRTLFGKRHWEAKLELRARCANETPPTSYCNPNTHLYSDPNPNA